MMYGSFSLIHMPLFERLKKIAPVFLIVLSLVLNILAPILAWQWHQLPFPGFLTEHTLVVAPIYNSAWLLHQQIEPGILIVEEMEGKPLTGSSALTDHLEQFSVGDQVEFSFQDLTTAQRVNATVRLTTFPWLDSLVIFWLPYLIGLIYLGVGLFIYQAQAVKIANQIFVRFCTLFSIFTASFFNIYTYHQLTALWILSLPFLGALLVDLGLMYPIKAKLIRMQPRLRLLPYLLATLLGFVGVITLYGDSPIGYFLPWRIIFAFVGVCILIFFAALLKGWYINYSQNVRRQTLVILISSLISFAPISLWSIADSWLGNQISFSPVLYSTLFGVTIFFPLSIAYVIFSAQRVKIGDAHMRRISIHAGLILAVILVYFSIIIGLNVLLGTRISYNNPTALIVYGLVVLVFFEPLRSWLEALIERLSPTQTDGYQEILQHYPKRLAALSLNIDDILDLYLQQVQAGIHTASLAIFFIDPKETIYIIRSRFGKQEQDPVQVTFGVDDTLPAWLATSRSHLVLTPEILNNQRISVRGEELARLAMMNVQVVVPLVGTEKLLGWIALGERHALGRYAESDLAFLTTISNQTAIALENAQRFEIANRKTQELILLQETTLDIVSEQETDRILTSVLERATKLLDSMGGSIFLLDEIQGQLNNSICFNLDADYASLSLKLGQGIAGRVAQQGQPAIVKYYKNELDQVKLHPGVEFGSVMAAPFSGKGQVKGVLELIRAENAPAFDQDELDLLTILANQAAIALDNARLIQDAHDNASQLTKLNEVNRIISATLKQDEALRLVMEAAVEMLNTEAGSIFLVSDDRQELIFEIALGPTGVSLWGTRMALDTHSIAGSIASSSQPMIVNNVAQNPHWNTSFDEASDFKTRDILGVPMVVSSQVVGVIEVINRLDGRGFTEEDLNTLQIFAGQAGIALLNARRFTKTDEALASTVQELNTLYMIDRELNAILEFEAVLNLLLSRTMDALGASVGLIGMINKDRTGIRLVSVSGISKDFEQYKIAPWPIEKGILGKVASTGKPILATNGNFEVFAIDKLSTSQLCIPIELEETVWGVMCLELAAAEPFTKQDKAFALRLAGHASLAIRNANLFGEVLSANDAKTEFMSVASHELKIPMTSIKGYAKLLGMMGNEQFTDQQKDFLNVINANIDRMDRLVRDLLDVSRIEAGRIRLEKGEVSIKAVIEEVTQSVNTQLVEKEISLSVEVPDTIPVLWADHGRLVQIMTNLIGNAYKYTPNGGQITVTAETRLDQTDDPALAVCISDTGYGISEEDQQKLFKKFFRADDPLIRDEAGTGLGLAITKSLVEIHGGEMWFESTLGKGSTFGFHLPLQPIPNNLDNGRPDELETFVDVENASA